MDMTAFGFLLDEEEGVVYVQLNDARVALPPEQFITYFEDQDFQKLLDKTRDMVNQQEANLMFDIATELGNMGLVQDVVPWTANFVTRLNKGTEGLGLRSQDNNKEEK